MLGRLKAILLPGRKVDIHRRFSLLREAISGTMSRFYMARDRRRDRIVGLKILDLEKTRAFEARFPGLDKPEEGEIAKTLQHPRIVRTYEYGITTKNEPFLVMEFLDGTDMNSLIIGEDTRLDGNRFLLIRQMAEAVSAVHRAGFLHRDICPRNFMVAKDGQSLKLIDFGLTVPATPTFMQPGNRTGTVNYMAPELVRRRSTDQRVDIFAYGVTTYELLTSQLPWPVANTGQDALQHDQPPKDIREYLPDLNPALAHAIHRCIEPVVAQRYPSMQDFLKAITGIEQTG